MMKKILILAPLTIAALALVWYLCIALDQEPISQAVLLEKYQYEPNPQLQVKLHQDGPNSYSFTYSSFDGELVNGKISYPDEARWIDWRM